VRDASRGDVSADAGFAGADVDLDLHDELLSLYSGWRDHNAADPVDRRAK
jgi:hypothetical protein